MLFLGFFAKYIFKAVIYLLLLGQIRFFQNLPGCFLQNYWFLSTPKIKRGCQLQCVSLAAAAPPLKWLTEWDMTQVMSRKKIISFCLLLWLSTWQTSRDPAKDPTHQLVPVFPFFLSLSLTLLPPHKHTILMVGYSQQHHGGSVTLPKKLPGGMCQNHLFSPLTVQSLLCMILHLIKYLWMV